MTTTLFEFDTTLFADSVEVIPNSDEGLHVFCLSSLGFFVSGTYQLDEATKTRNGSVRLHQLSVLSKSLELLYRDMTMLLARFRRSVYLEFSI